MDLQCEIGFELIGRFKMSPDDPPGFAGGEKLLLHFRDAAEPLEVTVTKCIDADGQRIVTFATPHIVRIEDPTLP
jgi:hypothetical protein